MKMIDLGLLGKWSPTTLKEQSKKTKEWYRYAGGKSQPSYGVALPDGLVASYHEQSKTLEDGVKIHNRRVWPWTRVSKIQQRISLLDTFDDVTDQLEADFEKATKVVKKLWGVK